MSQTVNPAFGFEGGMTERNQPLPIKFGLNTGMALQKFEMQHTQDGTNRPFIQIEFTTEGLQHPISFRLYELTQITYYDQNAKSNVTIENDFGHPEFQKRAAERRKYVNHLLSNIIGTTQAQGEEMIKQRLAALPTPITTYEQYCQFCVSLLPQGYQQIKFDLFLDYPYKIAKGKDRTYLGLAQYTEDGFFITRTQPGVEWTEKRMEELPANGRDSEIALKYVNAQGGTHLFQRDVRYMRSDRVAVQTRANASDALAAATPPANNAAGNSQTASGESFF